MANEKRLIDADALLELVQFRLPIDNQNAEVIAGCVDITRRLINNAPAVDAVEVKCKVGDWVYALWVAPAQQEYIIYGAEVKEIRIGKRNCRLTTIYRLEPIAYRGHIHEYRDEDFGRLVFPSQEEAEAALAKMYGGNEDG